MEWIVPIILTFSLFFCSDTKEIKKLKGKIKKLEKGYKGGCEMSKIISSLVGKQCKIKTDEGTLFSPSGETIFSVLDTDDEWMKLSYIHKKHGEKIKIIRIDSICKIELI